MDNLVNNIICILFKTCTLLRHLRANPNGPWRHMVHLIVTLVDQINGIYTLHNDVIHCETNRCLHKTVVTPDILEVRESGIYVNM